MTVRRLKSLLVAVREIERPPREFLGKAVRLAQRHAAKLELLHVIASPYVLPNEPGGIAAAKRKEVERQRLKLERVAQRFRNAGVDVSCSVVWDYPAADAIVRHVFKTRPDLVLAESHRHWKLARWFVTHTDWELIRSCPCPLWLVKTRGLADELRVLAAVDPFHTRSKPAALDAEIVRVGRIATQSATGDGGRLGMTYVYPLPIAMIAGGMGEPIWVAAPAAQQQRVKQRVSQAVGTLADRFDIPKADRIVVAGDAIADLPAVAKRWRANLLVMGAVSRGTIERVFIGNTAERVIDAAHCDVLIVKPRSFKSPVNRRANPPIIPMPPM